jgi:hypothetical protein
MKRVHAHICAGDWYHETWEHNGKIYHTVIPPRLSGDSENPHKEWDGRASLKRAMCWAGIDTLGHSDGEPYDTRVDDR